MNSPSSNRHKNWALPDDRWVILGLITAAVIWEIAGRSVFAVWDINNQAYGARYWAETGSPWMTVWMGLDLIIGLTSRVTQDTELAITILGCVFNGIATTAMYAVSRQAGISRFLSAVIGLITAIWFLPHLGGWIGDNISFFIGLSPALIYIITDRKWSSVNSFLLGITLALGITLKLNAFAPAFAISMAWLATLWVRYLISQNKEISNWPYQRSGSQLGIGLIGFAITVALIEHLIDIQRGVLPTVIETYQRVRESLANNQISGSRLVLIPLGVNFQDAWTLKQMGVLIFSPLAIGFWAAMLWSIKQLVTAEDEITRTRHEITIMIMLASAVTCVGLGRGLTHRMLLLPAGVLISLADLPLQTRYLKIAYTTALGAAMTSWLLFGWIQKDTDISSVYDSRQLGNSSQETFFCIGDGVPLEAQNVAAHIIRARPITDSVQVVSRQTIDQCWTSAEWRNDFAGLADVQEIANGMRSTYRNETPGKAIFREKWDSSQTKAEGRDEWLNREVETINRLRMPFLIERLTLSKAELQTPGYDQWEEGRQLLRQELVKRLDAHEVAKIGGASIWETKWRRNKQ